MGWVKVTQNICLSEGFPGKGLLLSSLQALFVPRFTISAEDFQRRGRGGGEGPVPHAFSKVCGLRRESGTNAQLLSGVPTGLVPVCE